MIRKLCLEENQEKEIWMSISFDEIVKQNFVLIDQKLARIEILLDFVDYNFFVHGIFYVFIQTCINQEKLMNLQKKMIENLKKRLIRRKFEVD